MPTINFSAQTASAIPDVNTYAKPVNGNGNHIVRLYEAQPKGLPHPWYFVHRENAPIGGVFVFTLYENSEGKQFVHLLKMKRPPLGGKISLELPAGIIGDKKEDKPGDETIINAARREVREETGFDAARVNLLTSHIIPVAQGLSSEINAFAMALVKGKPKSEDLRDQTEKTIITGQMHVPIETIANPEKFSAWVKQMSKEGYLIGKELFVARSLMPNLVYGKVPFSGHKLHKLG